MQLVSDLVVGSMKQSISRFSPQGQQPPNNRLEKDVRPCSRTSRGAASQPSRYTDKRE
jgi:hypothetical protein